MSSNEKNKPTYSLERRLLSCSVGRELLQELEDYTFRKAKELEPPKLNDEYRPDYLKPSDTYGSYTFTIEDSSGEEELSS